MFKNYDYFHEKFLKITLLTTFDFRSLPRCRDVGRLLVKTYAFTCVIIILSMYLDGD